MRIQEYISEENKQKETKSEDEKDNLQTKVKGTELQSIKAKAKQERALSKEALRQIKKNYLDFRRNNNQ